MGIKVSHSSLFESVPVEAEFIKKHMAHAPEGYVKVYLYALFACITQEDETLSDFAAACGIEQEDVLDALHYWEKRNFLRVTAEDPLSICILGAKYALPDDTRLYKYAELNSSLARLFGARQLDASDFRKIYDWIEVFGLAEQAVLLLVSHCIEKKGEKVSLQYMNKVAKSWADAGVFTLEQAQARLSGEDETSAYAKRILNHMGIYRLPTADERALAEKWRKEWGFELDAALAACREMTKIQQPNFAYLDKVLKTYHAQGKTTAAQIGSLQSGREHIKEQVSELFELLGGKRTASQEHADMYAAWLDMGFTHQTIRAACDIAKREGRRSFAALDEILRELARLKHFSAESIAEYAARQRAIDEDIKIIFGRCSMSGRVTPAHRTAYARWSDELAMPFEVILLAAQYSAFSKSPFAYMDKLLTDWHSRGITSVSAANRDLKSAKPMPSGEKKVQALDYQQRTYTDDELNRLFEDVSGN